MKAPQQSLKDWTAQKWRTKSGKPSSKTGERYLPEAAIKALTPAEYARTFFLRIGTGDGFGSGGIGINTRKFNIDLTTYAVDKTESEFRGEEDRRYVLSFSSGI